MSPIAAVLAVIVLVSITASPVLMNCARFVCSKHGQIPGVRRPGGSGVAITRSVKNQGERLAAVA